MIAALVDDRLTLLTAPEVARAFQAAYRSVFGREPTVRTLAILMAQSALESGRWKACHCFNFPNIKAAETYAGYYCLYRCNEIISGKLEWFDPPHPQCRFRAFLSADAGAVDYFQFLTRARYVPALTEAQRGDPSAFVRALKRGNFFTAEEPPYERAVVSLTSEYERQLPAWLAVGLDPEPEPSSVTDHELELLRATIVGNSLDWVHDVLAEIRHEGHQEMREAD